MKSKYIAIILALTFVLTSCGSKTISDKSISIEDIKASTETNLVQKIDSKGEENEVDVIKQDGPFGSISIELPDGWSYDLCPVGDENLYSADYGIHFFPSDAKEGYVELGYNRVFGVCGTGLITEAITLANDTVTIGYYDDSDIWKYIAFAGSNEGINAITYAVADWWENYSDQVMNILDTLSYNPDEQGGAIGIYSSDSEIEELQLNVSVKDISMTKATLVFNQYDDNITTELSFGEDFKIEKKDGDSWKEVDIVVEGEYGFHDIAHIIKTNDTTEYEYNWEWLYGSLEPGEYRIAVHVMSFKGTGDYENYIAYAHFVLN